MASNAARVQELMNKGVTTIPCLAAQELAQVNAIFKHVARTLPELRTDVPESERVPALGGFGALGLPSSFHHPFIRRLRELVYARLTSFFTELLAHFPGYHLEQLFDRMQLRQAGTEVTAESFHRDECNADMVEAGTCSCAEGDQMFGGWVNLDVGEAQGFSCRYGTHVPGKNYGKGFSALSPAEKAKYSTAESKKQNPVIVVPPGHVIIFYSNIVHEVLKKTQTITSARLYCCWRLTPLAIPLFPDVLQKVKHQRPMLLPSGQAPPMHAKLHWTNWADGLRTWSQRTVKDQYLVDRTFQSGKRQGETLRVVPMVMDHGDEFFPRYLPVEVLTHVPHDPRDPLVRGRNSVIEREWPRMLTEGTFMIPHYEAAAAASAAAAVGPPSAAAPQQYICRPQYGHCEPYDGVSATSSDAIITSSLQSCQMQCQAAQAARLGWGEGDNNEGDTEVDTEEEEEIVVIRPGGASAAKKRRVLDDDDEYLGGGRGLGGGFTAFFGMRRL